MKQNRIVTPTCGPDSWKYLLADPEKQWKPGYSAMAIAHSWENAAGLPAEVSSLFENAGEAELQDATLALAIPEYKVKLDGGNKPSQNDLFALLTCSGGLIATMIEGKAREDFGGKLSDWKKRTSPMGVQKRLAQIADCIGLKEPIPDEIRYQLLHRTASAIIEADRFHAPYALIVIQSFVNEDSKNHYSDFCNFIRLYGKVPRKESLIEISRPHGRKLYAAWVQSKPSYDVDEAIRQASKPDLKDKGGWDKVLEIGAEGGSITLYGSKDANGEWWFSRHTDERTMKDLLTEEDQIGLEFESFSERAKGWEGALKILSRYPWPCLYPLYVHPEFADSVMFEVKKASGEQDHINLRHWAAVSFGVRNN